MDKDKIVVTVNWFKMISNENVRLKKENLKLKLLCKRLKSYIDSIICCDEYLDIQDKIDVLEE